MAEVASPIIQVEMVDWVKLGGANLGIVGDPNHTYGFHRGARYVPATDYSRRRDPMGADGPYASWDWACAGDFGHRGDPTLRAMHKRVLAELMSGAYPMVCEFIGQPVAAEPVMYWSRWGGLERYTGEGHDLWSHISWYRSRANQRAYLWTPPPLPFGGTDMGYVVWLKPAATSAQWSWYASNGVNRQMILTWAYHEWLVKTAKWPEVMITDPAKLDEWAGLPLDDGISDEDLVEIREAAYAAAKEGAEAGAGTLTDESLDAIEGEVKEAMREGSGS